MTTRRAVFIAAAPKNTLQEHWAEQAKCAYAPEVDKQVMLSYFVKRSVALDVKKRYCDQCPVVTQCLNWAIEDWAFTGIAGGMLFAGERSSGQTRRMIKLTGGEA